MKRDSFTKNNIRSDLSGSCGVGFVCNIKADRSLQIIRWGIEAVKNLTHRGAVGADGKTGDGAGVLFQIPERFFLKEIDRLGYKISAASNLAVGLFFLRDHLEQDIRNILEKFDLVTVGWRDVPINEDALGKSALSTMPRIKQLFIDTKDIPDERREMTFYFARRAVEKTFGGSVYVVSLSSRTIVYKGMLVATNLDLFYPDLTDKDMTSTFCIFHQRFSTNTSPEWTLAQPFRVLAHNGEINTIQGNRNWMISMEQEIREAFPEPEGEQIIPLISSEESDSASLDRILELLILSGFSPEHAVNMCIPPALECCDFTDQLREKVDAFFDYQSLLMKPWDGPAAIVFTDGHIVGAHLDRNGLRPLRYAITDDTLILGSEAGMVDLGNKSKRKGRLGPGETLSVDTVTGRLKVTHEILEELAGLNPYGEWIARVLTKIEDIGIKAPDPLTDVSRKQIAFGYTEEEIQTALKEMALTGNEMTYSMGDDTPLPSLASKPQLLFRYFRQRFSQVTNPPIDHIRERMVMSLRMNLGYKMNFLHETPAHAHRLRLESPILLEGQIKAIEEQNIFRIDKIPATFSTSGKRPSLSQAVENLRQKVIASVKNGAEIIILSDIDISAKAMAIPSLLAVSACYKALQKEGLSNRVSLIVETGEARDIHHVACLIGYNASAVCPYLALQTIKVLCDRQELPMSYEKAVANYRSALEDGLLKVIAKMGISTLNSYYGAQLFDTICLNSDFVEQYFRGTPVSLEADGLAEIEHSLLRRHSAAFETSVPALDYGGALRYKKDGEQHAWDPASVIALKNFTKNAEYEGYRKFSRTVSNRPLFIRHLLDYKKGSSIHVDEVEPVDEVLQRFFSGAMSVGSLSPEAHEAIAEACNRIGIRSNCGEGGEDPSRYWGKKNSAIKQIASGRFGVTPAYIASARELEIKIAQGAKPGEGGHLPANKVTEYIASLRHCKPGIILISPPPHHDIYSIEDLAQLIHDLKETNPKAKVCVKLVSEAGVGTVAAGVAKAYADIVQICGCEGGTGAASISSIKNAGNYWEIGLAETQRVLVENGLREKIRVRVDGGFKSGRDVIIASLLGAEEFGFGTATMVAAGCVMARQCHLNTCPTGIATQDETLRKRFKGKPEDIMVFFNALAREVREMLAEMGFKTLREIIGRTDLISPVAADHDQNAQRIVLDGFLSRYPEGAPRTCTWERNDNPSPSMNDALVKDLLSYIEKAEPIEREYALRNINRSIPAKLNYYIASLYKDKGLPPDTLRLIFKGTAGQSFGAFNHTGLSLTLIGEANDYVAKGMFGGRIVIRPVDLVDSHRHVIAGNTVLYGATGGELYCAGRAGERFAVRNSGAAAVVEGTGHHLCEYMTRGIVVVLGETGYNIGAGMTGGTLYVYDERNVLTKRLNRAYVSAFGMADDDITRLISMLRLHHKYTESQRVSAILDTFESSVNHFKKIVPL